MAERKNIGKVTRKVAKIGKRLPGDTSSNLEGWGKLSARTQKAGLKHPLRATKSGLANLAAFIKHPGRTLRSRYTIKGQKARIRVLEGKGKTPFKTYYQAALAGAPAKRKLSKAEKGKRISEGLKKSRKIRRKR